MSASARSWTTVNSFCSRVIVSRRSTSDCDPDAFWTWRQIEERRIMVERERQIRKIKHTVESVDGCWVSLAWTNRTCCWRWAISDACERIKAKLPCECRNDTITNLLLEWRFLMPQHGSKSSCLIQFLLQPQDFRALILHVLLQSTHQWVIERKEVYSNGWHP